MVRTFRTLGVRRNPGPGRPAGVTCLNETPTTRGTRKAGQKTRRSVVPWSPLDAGEVTFFRPFRRRRRFFETEALRRSFFFGTKGVPGRQTYAEKPTAIAASRQLVGLFIDGRRPSARLRIRRDDGRAPIIETRRKNAVSFIIPLAHYTTTSQLQPTPPNDTVRFSNSFHFALPNARRRGFTTVRLFHRTIRALNTIL